MVVKTVLLTLFFLFFLGNLNTVHAVVIDCTVDYGNITRGNCQPTCDGGTWAREDTYSGYPPGNPNFGGECAITSYFSNGPDANGNGGCTQSGSQPICQSPVTYCAPPNTNYPCTGAGGVCAHASRTNDDRCHGLQMDTPAGGPGNFCYRTNCGNTCNSNYTCSTVWAEQNADKGGIHFCEPEDASSPYYCAPPPPPPAPTNISHSCGFINGDRATVTWNASAGATSYEIHMTSNQTGQEFVNTTTTSPSYTTQVRAQDTNYVQLYSLKPNAPKGGPTFYWFNCGKILASCNSACSTDSDCVTNYCAPLGTNGNLISLCRNRSYPTEATCQTPTTTRPPSACNGPCSQNSECQSNLSCYQGACRNPQNLTSQTCGPPSVGYCACGMCAPVWTAGGYTALQPTNCPAPSQYLSVTYDNGYLLPTCRTVPSGQVRNPDGCGFSPPATPAPNAGCASLPSNACNAQCPCSSGNCSI